MKRTGLYITGLAAVFSLFANTPACRADGLSTLAEVGQSQAQIQRDLAKETEAFDKIKRAVEDGSLRKGQSQDNIRELYGGPVITLEDKEYAEKWVYKPGNVSWFGGIRIYLIFDENKKLQGVKMLGK